MRLSVVCMLHEDGARVAAMAAQLREVADEIVLAADSRMDVAELAECAAVADRLLRFEFAGAARTLAWLHAQCTSEWILLIGSDEVPSPALVARLPELIRARDVHQYWIPTRTTYPDSGHWLDERPWFPDFHVRLVRNDASLAFPGIKHVEAQPAWPARFVEEPLYHLDCVLLSTEQRRAKVARYEQERPGLTEPNGQPFNAVYYLPEEHRRRPLQVVPPADRAALRAVLEAAPHGLPAPDPAAIPLATRAEIDRHWAGRSFAPGAYRARIELLERDLHLHPGERRLIALRIANEGDERWQWGHVGEHPIQVGHRIVDADGAVVVAVGEHCPLPAPIDPGTSGVVLAAVTAPEAEGEYVVEFDLVHEVVRWFECPLRVSIQVAPVVAPGAVAGVPERG